jgi:2,3-bisphosphoglycerate-independent phosphoglycerate mutase
MVHAFTDGRDTSPTGGAGFLEACGNALAEYGASIATVVGRYFAMDRDRRWDRTKKAWDAIVFGRGNRCEKSPPAGLRSQYEQNITDEFMPPLIFSHFDQQRVRDQDTVFFLTFGRTGLDSFHKRS